MELPLKRTHFQKLPKLENDNPMEIEYTKTLTPQFMNTEHPTTEELDAFLIEYNKEQEQNTQPSIKEPDSFLIEYSKDQEKNKITVNNKNEISFGESTILNTETSSENDQIQSRMKNSEIPVIKYFEIPLFNMRLSQNLKNLELSEIETKTFNDIITKPHHFHLQSSHDKKKIGNVLLTREKYCTCIINTIEILKLKSEEELEKLKSIKGHMKKIGLKKSLIEHLTTKRIKMTKNLIEELPEKNKNFIITNQPKISNMSFREKFELTPVNQTYFINMIVSSYVMGGSNINFKTKLTKYVINLLYKLKISHFYDAFFLNEKIIKNNEKKMTLEPSQNTIIELLGKRPQSPPHDTPIQQPVKKLKVKNLVIPEISTEKQEIEKIKNEIMNGSNFYQTMMATNKNSNKNYIVELILQPCPKEHLKSFLKRDLNIWNENDYLILFRKYLETKNIKTYSILSKESNLFETALVNRIFFVTPSPNLKSISNSIENLLNITFDEKKMSLTTHSIKKFCKYIRQDPGKISINYKPYRKNNEIVGLNNNVLHLLSLSPIKGPEIASKLILKEYDAEYTRYTLEDCLYNKKYFHILNEIEEERERTTSRTLPIPSNEKAAKIVYSNLTSVYNSINDLFDQLKFKKFAKYETKEIDEDIKYTLKDILFKLIISRCGKSKITNEIYDALKRIEQTIEENCKKPTTIEYEMWVNDFKTSDGLTAIWKLVTNKLETPTQKTQNALIKILLNLIVKIIWLKKTTIRSINTLNLDFNYEEYSSTKEFGGSLSGFKNAEALTYSLLRLINPLNKKPSGMILSGPGSAGKTYWMKNLGLLLPSLNPTQQDGIQEIGRRKDAHDIKMKQVEEFKEKILSTFYKVTENTTELYKTTSWKKRGYTCFDLFAIAENLTWEKLMEHEKTPMTKDELKESFKQISSRYAIYNLGSPLQKTIKIETENFIKWCRKNRLNQEPLKLIEILEKALIDITPTINTKFWSITSKILQKEQNKENKHSNIFETIKIMETCVELLAFTCNIWGPLKKTLEIAQLEEIFKSESDKRNLNELELDGYEIKHNLIF